MKAPTHQTEHPHNADAHGHATHPTHPAQHAPHSAHAGHKPRFNWAFILPIAFFFALAGALWVGLYLNPRDIPSALINKPVPSFALPPLPGMDNGLTSSDLKLGRVSVLNVFASWCVPCRIEHPFLTELAKRGDITLVALNYKDEPTAATAWLKQFGDPFARIGADRDGRVAIDFGVYGVPETFVITGDGTIIYKHVGPLNDDAIRDKIVPMIIQAAAKK